MLGQGFILFINVQCCVGVFTRGKINEKVTALVKKIIFRHKATLGTGASIGTEEGDHWHTGRSVRERIFVFR